MFETIINAFATFPNSKNLMEIGGADRPLDLTKSSIVDGLDIAKIENAKKLYNNYYRQSVEEVFPGGYDLIYSMTLLEHVPDNQKSIKNIYNALNNSGKTVHYIPSKFHPYSLILRLVGPKFQVFFIRWLRPEALEVSGYPSFFNCCSPNQMEALFESVGFEKVEIHPFYRANDYFAFFVPVYILVSFYENFCKFFNIRVAASGFILTAEKGEK